MSNVKKFLLTVMIGIVALILEFGFHQNQLAFWLIAILENMEWIFWRSLPLLLRY